jgi:hypothetical protein
MGAGIFGPSLLDWLFGGGIGTNIGASIVWGLAAGFAGYFLARKVRRAWERLHSKLDRHASLHDEHAAKLDHLIAHSPSVPPFTTPSPPAPPDRSS